MQTKPKLRVYRDRLLKSEYRDELYTSTVNILSHRSFLARLRGGTAPLHGNSSSKTAELIYNIFMARKCVNL